MNQSLMINSLMGSPYPLINHKLTQHTVFICIYNRPLNIGKQKKPRLEENLK